MHMVKSQHELGKGCKAPPVGLLSGWSFGHPNTPHVCLQGLFCLDFSDRREICINIPLALSLLITLPFCLMSLIFTNKDTQVRKRWTYCFTSSLNKCQGHCPILRVFSQSFQRTPHSFTHNCSKLPTGRWGWNKLAFPCIHVLAFSKLFKTSDPKCSQHDSTKHNWPN